MSLSLLRKDKGLTCKDVAEKMGIHASYYSHLETGKRRFTPELTDKLALALDEPLEMIKEKISQINDQGILVRSWVTNIKIHGQNVLKAFENELLFERPYNIDGEIKFRFADFIRQNIAQSIMTELDGDTDLLDMLIKRYKHLEVKKH